MDAGDLLGRLTDALDARDWDAIPALCAEGFTTTLLHTGERFDAASYARFNADYPGVWRVHREDLVGDGDRAAVRARLVDADGSGETYHVAMFATARDGLLAELVEVWADGQAVPPPERRP